jgi:hypothetical protein
VDNDDSAKRRLDNFINKVTRKRDSPLIHEPPKQPLAKLALSWQSMRWQLRVSRVPASERGEVLIMQRMACTKGPSESFASELETFDKLFDGNRTATNAEAPDALFPVVEKDSFKQPRRRKATSYLAKLRWYWLLFLCNIEIRCHLL